MIVWATGSGALHKEKTIKLDYKPVVENLTHFRVTHAKTGLSDICTKFNSFQLHIIKKIGVSPIAIRINLGFCLIQLNQVTETLKLIQGDWKWDKEN